MVSKNKEEYMKKIISEISILDQISNTVILAINSLYCAQLGKGKLLAKPILSLVYFPANGTSGCKNKNKNEGKESFIQTVACPLNASDGPLLKLQWKLQLHWIQIHYFREPLLHPYIIQVP